MVKEFSKPQPARQLEARARARTLGVRVAVLVEARRYVTHAQSRPGVTYIVVSHRPSVIERAAQVVTLADGRIVDRS